MDHDQTVELDEQPTVKPPSIELMSKEARVWDHRFCLTGTFRPY
jgi:hypothetical protein